MKIRILPAAEHDLELGADFYESQREGLGRYFNDCLMADIESLRIYAGVHGKVHDLFRCLSKCFPFAIFYDISPDMVDIYAVLDCRQDPRKIKARLRSPQTTR